MVVGVWLYVYIMKTQFSLLVLWEDGEQGKEISIK